MMPGFNRWTKTWIAEYASVEEIYWNVPGDAIDFTRLPRRAFDSAAATPGNRATLRRLQPGSRYISRTRCAFAALAAARIHAAPLRYYIWLPALRIADMWLRPRTELLPSDPRWWEFNDDRSWLAVSIVFGLVNLAYVAAAVAGFVRGARNSRPRTSCFYSCCCARSFSALWKTPNLATRWNAIPWS